MESAGDYCRDRLRVAVRDVTSTLAFSAGLAAMLIVFGTRDLESYEHVFFSLDRGTALEAIHVFGHPVYTLAVGLGVRLPLQASLGASPVAAVAPYLLAPVTYWLLLAVSIAAAVLIVRHALEPLCGRLVSWAAVVLLFCSVPIVTYTVYNDWPEVVVTYCAFVGCVFAPHALLALLDAQRTSHVRRLGGLSLAGLVWGLVALSHPGYWPLLAVAIVCATGVALCRTDYPLRARLTIVVLLGTVSLIAVAVQVPDITRELDVAGGGTAAMRRYAEGPAGSLIAANAFPFGAAGPKSPFTYLVLALVSLAIGLASRDVPARRLIVASALVSIALAVGAATLFPGSAPYAPSGTWALRDPAAIFAVLSGACAAGAVARSRAGNRLVGAGFALAALAFAGAQGPSYAVRLVFTNMDGPLLGLFIPQPLGYSAWTGDMTGPAERVSMRGLARDRVLPGARLALWPGVRDRMRNTRHASTDFADAGYPLVTAWTKQRTMRGLVEPNEFLFNQTTDLSSQVLCDTSAVRFLQLRYLLTPSDVECEPWRRLPGLLVDGWLEVRVATQRDDRVSALPVAGVSQRTRGEPALSAGSLLLPALETLPGTSLRVGPRNVVIRLDDSSAAAGRSLVLPVAYDPAWHASSGHIQNIGGLLALVGVDQRQVTLDFVPDIVAVVRALSMTVAQVFAVVGFLGLASVRRVAADDAAVVAFARVPLTLSASGARRVFAVISPIPRQPRNWLYLGYSAAVVQRLDWRPEDSDETRLLIGLLLPIIALAVANLARLELCARWIGGAVLALALVRVGTYGSLSAQALHDPLFWGATALVALAVSGIAGRRPAAASTTAALAGVCAMVAILLPMFPGFDVAFPSLNITVIKQSFGALSYQLGVVGAALLLGIWLHAIVIGGGRGNRISRIGAAARGALLAALVLTLAGVVPTTEGIGPGWIAALGILLGLAEAPVRSKPDETHS